MSLQFCMGRRMCFDETKKPNNSAELALRFNTDKPSLLDAADTMCDGTRISYRLLSLPLYLIDYANRLTVEASRQ